MNSEEPLLKLHRDFTDKEKLDWLRIDYRKLEKKLSEIELENENLKIRNKKLSDKIKKDDLQFPSALNGEKTVSVKAYFKLRKMYDDLDKRFWEVIQELNQYKIKEELI